MPSPNFSLGFNPVSARLQRQLQSHQVDINQTLERLSSGLRINRAADAPAGITVAKKLETRLLSQGQAAQNLREGTLLTATAAEGAQQVLESLKEIRSLTLASLSDTTSTAERETLQQNLKNLVKAVDQVARSTSFNTRKLLDGSASASALFRPAESEVLFNRTVTDTSTGVPTEVSFIENIVRTDPGITRDSVISFRLFDSGSDFAAGLEIYSSELGLITVTDNYLAFPNTYNLPTESLSGGPVVRVSLADLGYNQPDPLTLNEYQNVSLQSLVDDRRILPVSYGALNVTLGGITYNGIFNVQPTSTLEDVVNGINGATVGSGTLTAAYDPGTQRVTVGYANQRTLVEQTDTAYTPTVPLAAGGPLASFAALGAPAEGPAYRNPDAFLPTSPFNKSSPPPGTVFPNAPANLNTALSFTGSNASVLSVFGLSNLGDSGLISDYTATYTGVTVATGNPSEFVNRTQVRVTSVSSENRVNGLDTGLSATDGNTRLEVLSTAQVDLTPFGSGDFSIDFGENGEYTFAGFDPAVHSIQDIVDDINAYATTQSVAVSASFDAGSNQLTFTNTPITPTGNNQIVFTGANALNIQQFFRVSDQMDDGTGNTQTLVSTGDISSQALDASLDISAADVANKTLQALMTARLSTVSGALRINGQTLINVGNNTTLNQIVTAINGFSASNNRDYTASFDVEAAGGLSIFVRDTESVAAPSSPAPADPNGLNPQVNGNQITLDSSAFIAEEAPLSYNGGTPLGSGSGPAEQLSFQSPMLSPQYNVNAPDPSTADISSILFSGSNIARVVHLQDAVTGTPNAVAGSDRFRGQITITGSNNYILSAEYQRDFSAVSSTTSTRSIGYETPVGQEPEFGVVGEIFVRANRSFVAEDNALGIQRGIDEGQYYRLGIQNLTASALRLETLRFVGSNAEQTRLLGLETLKVVDEAIDTALQTLAELGAQQRVIEQGLAGAAFQQEGLQQALSNAQDADLPAEIAGLTRAQINVQAASFALAEQQQFQQRTLERLLSNQLLGDMRLRDL